MIRYTVFTEINAHPEINIHQKQWFFKGRSTQNRWLLMGDVFKGGSTQNRWVLELYLLLLKIKRSGRLFRQIGILYLRKIFTQVSLAYADLLVLLSAVPEAIVFHHVGRCVAVCGSLDVPGNFIPCCIVILFYRRWLFGQTVCSLFIFINFLGINAGSTRYCYGCAVPRADHV